MRVHVVASFDWYVAREAFFVQRLVAGFAVPKVPESPAAGCGVLLESLTMTCRFTGDPATKACTRPKTWLSSSDGTRFQCSATMIAPSGNGSLPSRYAFIATSLPSCARSWLKSPSSWVTEINFQSRYPEGIVTP